MDELRTRRRLTTHNAWAIRSAFSLPPNYLDLMIELKEEDLHALVICVVLLYNEGWLEAELSILVLVTF